MILKFVQKEIKKDKFDREYVCLEFYDEIKSRVWRFWLYSWLIQYHTEEVYNNGLALEAGDHVDVLWRKANYRGSDIQILTQINKTAAEQEFYWK